MPKFIAVTEDAKEPEVPKIKFMAAVDEDGDFVILANGEMIAWISAEDGDLCLAVHTQIPGLKYRTPTSSVVEVWWP